MNGNAREGIEWGIMTVLVAILVYVFVFGIDNAKRSALVEVLGKEWANEHFARNELEEKMADLIYNKEFFRMEEEKQYEAVEMLWNVHAPIVAKKRKLTPHELAKVKESFFDMVKRMNHVTVPPAQQSALR